MLSDEEDNLIDCLEENFGCHTVILYGSRGQGTHHAQSDWDVLGITDVGGRNFLHERVEGVGDVSGHIHNSDEIENSKSSLYNPPNHFVRLRHGRVLVQQDGMGDAIIARARKMYQGPPPKLSAEQEYHHRYNLQGYGLGGLRNVTYAPEHRELIRGELFMRCFYMYFALRGMWQPSPKDTIRYLEMADAKGYALMQAAMKPNAPIEAIEAWVQHVLTVEPI